MLRLRTSTTVASNKVAASSASIAVTTTRSAFSNNNASSSSSSSSSAQKSQVKESAFYKQGRSYYHQGAASLFAAGCTASLLAYFMSEKLKAMKSHQQRKEVASCADWKEISERADELHAADKVQESYDLTKSAVASSSSGAENVDLLWRYGRALYLMGKNCTGDAKKKEEFVRESVTVLQKALDKDPNNWAANKWMGMSLGQLGDFISTNEKIGNSFKIRDHFQKAIDGNPRDATSLHCMGVWCWNILQVAGWERQIASWIFSSPPQTSFEECEAALLKSNDCNSDQPHNSLQLGDLYAWKGDKENARKWYKHATTCTANTDYQREYLSQAEKKLKEL